MDLKEFFKNEFPEGLTEEEKVFLFDVMTDEKLKKKFIGELHKVITDFKKTE